MTHPDAIQPVPADAPGWCENMVLQVFDSVAGVSVWAHWGRMTTAPHVWEGLLAVFLGDGRLLMHRGFDTALEFSAVEPGRRWRVTFDGMMRPVAEADLQAGPLRDGAVEHVALDLCFEGIHEMHGGAAEGQRWATAHVDQGGRITGTVCYDGREYAIDSGGFRDHSYGARDYGRIVGDTWCTAVFGSGRALLGIEVWQADGPTHADGFLFDGAERVRVTQMELPRLTAVDGSPHAFTMTLNDEAITVQQHASMTMTFGRPVGLVAGALIDGADTPVISEGPATITWNGETADGWIEKSLRPSLLS